MNMNSTKIADLLLKPALVGTFAGLGAYYIFGETGLFNFPIIGNVNTIIGIGAITAGSSFLGSLSEDYILPYLPNNAQYSSLEAKLITPVMSGLITTGLLYSSLNSDALFQVFLLGAGSNIAGTYSYDIIRPYVKV